MLIPYARIVLGVENPEVELHPGMTENEILKEIAKFTESDIFGITLSGVRIPLIKHRH
jgi:hypothetical protein